MSIRDYRHLLNNSASIFMLLVHSFMFGYVWFQFYVPVMKRYNLQFDRGDWAVIAMYMLLLFLISQYLGASKIGYLRIADICFSNLLALLITNVIGYFQIVIAGRLYFDLVPYITMTITQMAFVIPWVMLIRSIYIRLYPPRDLVVIYGDYAPDNLIRKINSRKERYNICEQISVYEDINTIYEKIRMFDAVVLCDLPVQLRNQILKHCYDRGIRTYITPKVSDIILGGTEQINLFDTPLLLSRNRGLTIEQRFFKRIVDVILSVVTLLIASPVMLVVALAIKLHDRGAVFYVQERTTRNGKTFRIYKFRSMKMNSESMWSDVNVDEDSRVTPVGRFIRKLHIDELPQIFNILNGDMSWVGPRPEWNDLMSEYEKDIPEFSFRYKVKSGLTGYAQVYGKYNTTALDKLKLDLTYVENYTFWLDIKILLLTIKVLIQGDDTQGKRSRR